MIYIQMARNYWDETNYFLTKKYFRLVHMH